MSSKSSDLSRRQRQIMDVIYKLGRASAADVMQRLPDPPSYSAVRTLLGILETRGLLRHVREGQKYVYLPTRSRTSAARAAMRRLLDTFFNGSTEQAVAAILDAERDSLDDQQLDRLRQLIEQARKEGQ